jgi:ribonuclease HII
MLQPRHTEDEVVEAGIDEAGRGCLWGSLVAAAVVWPAGAPATWPQEVQVLATQVRDSKKLSAKKRAALETGIKAAAVAWGLGVVTPEEIDARGMTWANRAAFERAAAACSAVKPERLVIDGILGLEPATLAGLGVKQQVVEAAGDGTYLAVAAASILAKEGRDRMVAEAVAADPELQSVYGILNSKGYGTAKHRDAIKARGMLPGHRRLFLRKLLGLDHTVSEEGFKGGGSGGASYRNRPVYDFLEDEDAV